MPHLPCYAGSVRAVFTPAAVRVFLCPPVHTKTLLSPTSFAACGLVTCPACSRGPSFTPKCLPHVQAKAYSLSRCRWAKQTDRRVPSRKEVVRRAKECAGLSLSAVRSSPSENSAQPAWLVTKRAGPLCRPQPERPLLELLRGLRPALPLSVTVCAALSHAVTAVG